MRPLNSPAIDPHPKAGNTKQISTPKLRIHLRSPFHSHCMFLYFSFILESYLAKYIIAPKLPHLHHSALSVAIVWHPFWHTQSSWSKLKLLMRVARVVFALSSDKIMPAAIFSIVFCLILPAPFQYDEHYLDSHLYSNYFAYKCKYPTKHTQNKCGYVVCVSRWQLECVCRCRRVTTRATMTYSLSCGSPVNYHVRTGSPYGKWSHCHW